ncbi:hypothetical protein, partial [Prevotella sp.]|uniref:hypothetical protein n=1 Tax=Prevotella sp. TaxID=59823 RepID=UPI00307FE96B
SGWRRKASKERLHTAFIALAVANIVTFYLKLIGHLFQLASTYNKNHIHLLILCIGYSQYNCIKIQLAELPTGPSRYGQTTHKDSQEADKPVLPASGGDRVGR